MSSIAQGARGGTAARRRPAARAKTNAKAKSRLLGGGVVSIVLFAALLAGVVAVNVAVLRLNVELDRTGRERSQLKADVAGLRAELSSTSATSRIAQVATEDLGLVPADPETTTYVPLGR
jgi:cell division protein FtsL